MINTVMGIKSMGVTNLKKAKVLEDLNFFWDLKVKS